MHGAGFTGSGEQHLASVVSVEAAADGHIRVLSASTEIGQGTNTIFAQIAARRARHRLRDVEVVQPDTAAVPDSGPTVASRTCMVVGKLVESAALGLKSVLSGAGLLPGSYDSAAFRSAAAAYVAQHGSLRGTAQYQPPEGLRWDDEKYQGDAYGAYGWAVYVAEVAVDLVTFDVRVEDFVAVQEVGRVINPVLAAGQIEGGVAQGIGWAIYEQVVWREGRMANGQMTNYIMPTSMDLPPIRVEFVEFPYPARTRRREGDRRAADGRSGAGHLQRGEKRDGCWTSRRLPLTPEDLDSG